MPGEESITGDAARSGGVKPEGQPQEGGSSLGATCRAGLAPLLTAKVPYTFAGASRT
jgi:hypothetical protein